MKNRMNMTKDINRLKVVLAEKKKTNVPRRGPVPKFSDLEVVALSLTAETESIDSEKWLFDYKLQEYKDNIPNLISRRQFNDRRKKTAGLCEELRKRIAMEMDGGEEQFFVDSKPIEVCRVARGKRCKMGYRQFLASSRLRLLCFAEHVLFWL